MVEAAAEVDEDTMNKYLEGETLTEERSSVVCAGTLGCEIQPMLCGSAFKNKGVQRMLDAVIELLPAPLDVPPVPGELEDGSPDHRDPSFRRCAVLRAGLQADERSRTWVS